MAKSRTHHIGRLVTVVLEPGEPLLASVAQVASSMGISFASVSFRANLSSARLILGRRRYTRRAHDPDRVSFDDGREVVGNGHITQSESGSVEVALRCAVGREREVLVADIVEATVGDGATLTLVEGYAAA
ncbi:MAG: hypothetical protein GEU81_07700 [Nitriliruptorales bacterium]|nr:hypothetical protein [Nitriliruptorales bacterium]